MFCKSLPIQIRSGGASLWGIILVVLTLAGIALMMGLQPPTVVPIRPTPVSPPVLGRVADFQLTNQFGEPVTLTNLLGKVWIADIVFTRCAGPCPVMTRQMSELQPLLEQHWNLMLVTLTTDPLNDTPTVMKAYGEKFGARSPRWLFLSGDKTEVARLAVSGLKLTAVETAEAERQNPADLFIHSTLFVVVDKRGRLRAAVETQDDPPAEGAPPSMRNQWEAQTKGRLAALVAQLEEEK